MRFGLVFLCCAAILPVRAENFFGIDAGASANGRSGVEKCPRSDGDSFKYVVDVIADSGFSWARERLYWPMFNPRRGEFANLERFMSDNRYYAERGVRPSWIFHVAPEWTNPVRRFPTDLKGLYDFAHAIAASIAPQSVDWEVWNEPDLGASVETAWNFAAVIKTAALSFKAANPGSTVLMGSLCEKRRNAFDEALFANDIGEYTDAVNYHLYFALSEYPVVFDDMWKFLETRGLGDRALWVTEAGGKQEGDATGSSLNPRFKAHSAEQELYQAEFAVKGLVLMQMGGVSRAYPFYLSPYNERNGLKDWGFLRRDGSAKAGLAWMQEMVRNLKGLKIVGELERPVKGVRAFLYESGSGAQAVVHWAETSVDTVVGPFDVTKIGNPEISFSLRVPDGPNRSLVARRRPGYVHGLSGLSAVRPARPAGRVGAPPALAGIDRTLVLNARVNEDDFFITEQKGALERRGNGGRLAIDVWNFSDREKRVSLRCEGGTFACDADALVTLPGGKATFDGRLVAVSGGGLCAGLTVRAVGTDGISTKLHLPILNYDRWRMGCESVELDWRKVGNWRENTSATRHSVSFDEAEDAIKVDLAWESLRDHWCYPFLAFDREKARGAEFLEFEIKATGDRVGEGKKKYFAALAMVDRADGTKNEYLGYTPPGETWERRRVRIDAHRPEVTSLRLGLNPAADHHVYWLRNLRWIKEKK